MKATRLSETVANKYAQFSKAPKRPRRGSPSDIIRFRKCELKAAYKTMEEAESASARQLFGNRAYRCNFCKAFHLTSKG